MTSSIALLTLAVALALSGMQGESGSGVTGPALGRALPDEEAPAGVPTPQSAEALCAGGDHHLDDAGSPAIPRARRMFETAIQQFPDAACGHAGLSRALVTTYLRRLEEDDALVDRAIEEARRAVRLDPRSATAHAALAGALLAGLDMEHAEVSAQAALSAAPESVPALQTAAMVRLAGGHLKDARAAIDAAIGLAPNLPVSYQIRGNIQLLSGDRHDAIDSYRNALKLLPDFTPAVLQIAATYEEMGNYPAAGQIFRDLIQDHPEETARAYLYMGRSLMKRGQWSGALAALDKAEFKTRRGLSNGTAIYLKALCYEQLARYDEARAAFRKVIDEWPDATSGYTSVERLMYPAYEGLGRLLLRQRDGIGAQAVMEEGIARAGASLDLYLRLARLYEEYRLPERAVALMEQAVARELGPNNADDLLSAYVVWARLGRQLDDRASLERFTVSLDAQSERLAALNDYVHDLDAMRAYSLAGRGDKALAILKRGLASGTVQVEWLKADPALETLRATPEFKRLASTETGDIPPRH